MTFNPILIYFYSDFMISWTFRMEYPICSLTATVLLMILCLYIFLYIYLKGRNSTYNILNEYECLPCAEGCDSCEDGSPCIAALNWPMRTSILVLACIVIGLLPPAAWFTFRYQQVKVSHKLTHTHNTCCTEGENWNYKMLSVKLYNVQ